MTAPAQSRWWIVPLGTGGTSREVPAEPLAWLGEEGATWVHLSRARLPVLPGLIITAEVCGFFCRHGGRYPPGVWDRIRQELDRLSGLRLNERDAGLRPLWLRWIPLLPRKSDLPGCESVVVGLNEGTIQQFASVTGTAAPAWRAYARLIRTYAVCALGQAPEEWSELRHSFLQRHGVGSESLLDSESARELCAVLLRRFVERTRRAFPRELTEQLRGLLTGLYERWRARDSATRNRMVLDPGIPVALTWAVFGDMDEHSARCVLWSRDPVTGATGIRGCLVPDESARVAAPEQGLPVETLQEARSAELRAALWTAFRIVEQAELVARRPQQLEIVIERSRVWIAGVLPCHRTPEAAMRWAIELATGRDLHRGRSVPKLWTVDEALCSLDPNELTAGMRPADHPKARPSAAGITLLRWAAERHDFEMIGLVNGAAKSVPQWIRRHLRALCVGVLLGAPAAAPRTAGRWRRRVLWWLQMRDRTERLGFGESRSPESTEAGADSHDGNVDDLDDWLRRTRAHGKGMIEIVLDAGDLGEAACDRLRRVRETLEELPVRPVLHLRLSIPRAALAADAAAEWTDRVWFDVAGLDAFLRGREVDALARAPRAFDLAGVGVLIETGWQRLRTAQPGIRGGLWLQSCPDPALVRFAQRLGLRAIVCPLDLVASVHVAVARTAAAARLTE